MSDLISTILELWSDINPVAGYTSGHLDQLTSTAPATPSDIEALRERVRAASLRLNEIGDADLRVTAAAILSSLRTQFAMARPSGAGPSGTGMSGVYTAADGIFYILLKADAGKPWVAAYLEATAAAIRYETQRWFGQDFTVLVRRECLDTVAYVTGTVTAMQGLRPDLGPQCQEITTALAAYAELFTIPGLDAADFTTYWPIFQQWDATRGAAVTPGYPACLQGYYQLPQSIGEIQTMAAAWLDLDLPVLSSIAAEVASLPFIGSGGTLQDLWGRVSAHYAVDFDQAYITAMVKATDDYSASHIVAHTAGDVVQFAPTPDYLVNLVTGGEDFAVNYLNPETAYSQLYLTAAKNTSMLTMLNILVHEASHGYNFVLSAKNTSLSPLLNLNTALEVPTTEGMAFWREFEFYAAAQQLIDRDNLDPVEAAYLALYGATPADQRAAVLCAQLETFIWRIVRYVRALCDVRVNAGLQTYTDFIGWAASATGLSEEFLHGECFTFMASPGYAPCYALGAVAYASAQARAEARGVPALQFNTSASSMGFYPWPLALTRLDAAAALPVAAPPR